MLAPGASPSVSEKLIPTPSTPLTMPLPLLVEGPDGHRNQSGGSGRRRDGGPGGFRHGVPGRVHPGAQALCRMSLGWTSALRKKRGQQEWTNRVRNRRAGRSESATNTELRRFSSAPLPPRDEEAEEGPNLGLGRAAGMTGCVLRGRGAGGGPPRRWHPGHPAADATVAPTDRYAPYPPGHFLKRGRAQCISTISPESWLSSPAPAPA